MVIGDDFSVALHEKAGTEDVNPKMGSRAAVGELHHAFVVDQRLASSIDGDLNGMAGLLVKEFDDNVEQADAGAVVVDDGFSDLAFAFEQFQAMLRVCELELQGISIRAARRSYFLTEILRLLFQRITCDRCRLRLHLKRPRVNSARCRSSPCRPRPLLRRAISARNRRVSSRVRRLEMPRSIAASTAAALSTKIAGISQKRRLPRGRLSNWRTISAKCSRCTAYLSMVLSSSCGLRSRTCALILAANSTASKGNEMTSSAPRSKARARSTAPP